MDETTSLLERSPGLVAQVTQHLLDAIDAGRMLPGDRLVETELAAKLGVSRAPLREALRQLSSTGVVEHRVGRGAYVASPSADSVEQMSIFRGLLEGDAAGLLAGRRNAAALAELDVITKNMEAADEAADSAGFIHNHWLFHRAICVGSGNEYLLESWDRVSRHIRIYLNMQIQVWDHARVLRNNRGIVKALKGEPPVVAGALVRSLIIRQAFLVRNLQVPGEVAHFVTHAVTEDGEVVALTEVRSAKIAGERPLGTL